MKVGMYYNNNDVRVEEQPVPAIGNGEILLKTEMCGICGTDVLEWYRIKTAPRVLGHETVGVIAAVGDGVMNFKIGDMVFVSHHVPCNECRYCRRGFHTACVTLHKTNFFPGGFAQFIRVPEINVQLGTYLLPENVSFEQGVFIEPLGCVLRGQRVVDVKEEDTVIVIGSGISGLLHVKAAKLRGAKRIIATDVNEFRLGLAKRFGADFVINAKEDVVSVLKNFNDGRLADVVILCTGAVPAINHALRCVDKGGRILFFAAPEPSVPVNIPINDFWRNEVKVMTSYGAAPNDMQEALDVISSERIVVEDMVTHKLPLSRIGEGFRLVAEARDSVKVVIQL